VALIGFFNYFYTFVQMDPNDVGENLKKAGASIPNVRPGKATAAFIETVSPIACQGLQEKYLERVPQRMPPDASRALLLHAVIYLSGALWISSFPLPPP
jgi:hypothetical protein